MTQVVVTHPRSVAQAPEAVRSPASKAEKVAITLRRINERLIAPRLQIRETVSGEVGTRARAIAGSSPPNRKDLLKDDVWAEQRRGWIKGDLAIIPSLDTLRPLLDFAEQAFNQPADRAQNRLLIGLMVDAYPNARPHSPETYFEALAHEIGESGYAPVVVACALRGIVREKTFAPSIAEVLGACEMEAMHQGFDARSLATEVKAREWLDEAAPIIAAYEAGERFAPPPPQPSGPWKEGDAIPF